MPVTGPSLLHDFEQWAGAAADGLWSAPGRANLIGEHTDYNDGFALPFALDLSCLVAGRRREDGVLQVRSLELGTAAPARVTDLGQVRPGDWSGYPLGMAWALQARGVELPGADLLVSSQVPPGAGLSSSAALECAVGLALCDLAGVTLPATELALAGQRAETEVVGAPVGVMDQMASLHGRAGSAVLLDCRSLEVRHVALPDDRAGVALLVIDTRVAHAHATGAYRQRRRSCEEAAQLMGVPALRDASEQLVTEHTSLLGDERTRRARHVVTENARVRAAAVALDDGDLEEVSRLMVASHRSLQQDFEVSCAELDTAVDAALAAGALGARMTGGGFGGSVIALVLASLQEEVAKACTAAAAREGHPVPAVRRVRAADGAHRIRSRDR